MRIKIVRIKKESNSPRANSDIQASEVRVLDESGEMLGVFSTRQAVSMAFERGLDLVEVSPNANPPVCRIIGLGKYKYQQQKKLKDNKKKQKVVHIKEIKLRPTTDTHDYEVKLKSIEKFLNSGDKVKISVRFRGREIAHSDIGLDLIQKIKLATEEIAKAEYGPRMEGRQAVMILTPK